MEANCQEFTVSFDNPNCGDWLPLGGANGDLTSSFWGDRTLTLGLPSIISQVERFAGDNGTLWAATDSGRLFVTYNGNAANQNDVTYTRVDSLVSNDPERFISSIYIDPANKNHVWLSYSGYNAHTPSTPGHVFEVTYDPGAGTATWADRSYNLDDLLPEKHFHVARSVVGSESTCVTILEATLHLVDHPAAVCLLQAGN